MTVEESHKERRYLSVAVSTATGDIRICHCGGRFAVGTRGLGVADGWYIACDGSHFSCVEILADHRLDWIVWGLGLGRIRNGL